MQQPKIIKPENAIYAIHKYNKLGSTNEFLKKQSENLPDYTVIWTEDQTTGRGRFTRKWNSIPGKDLTFSILLPLTSLKPSSWPNITQIAALAIAELLEDYGLTALIKWPNDVLVEQKKICGILCETVKRNKLPCAVLGIGLNVNRSSESLSQIDQPATSMKNELHHTVSCNELLRRFLDKIILFFSELQENGFTGFSKKIRKRLAYVHKQSIVTGGTKEYNGQILDINTDGTLLFKCNDGSVINLHSGEITFFSF